MSSPLPLAEQLPEPTTATPAQRRITVAVKVLLALHEMERQELARHLGWDKSQVTRALANNREWRVDDLEALGRIFGRDVTYFLQPSEELVRSRWGLGSDLASRP